MIFVGDHADPEMIRTLFKVESFHTINKEITEEEIFEDVESSPYLTALYSIINQLRYQRQPFCPLKVCLWQDQ